MRFNLSAIRFFDSKMYFCNHITEFMLNRIKIIFSLFVITLPFAGIGQEITARVAGLENDSTYMSLLKKEQLLRHTEDSIVQTINTTRQLFTSDIPESEKEQYATKILQLEKELFEVRNQQGITTNEISVIEQDFILKNLNGTGGNVTEQTVEPAAKQVANLVYNTYFKENLSDEDYEALCRSQELEKVPILLLSRYMDTDRTIDSLAILYDTTTNKSIAETCYIQIDSLKRCNQAVDDSLAQTWSYIYDNKTYAYNYLLEKMGKTEMLKNFDTRFQENRQLIASAQDSVASGTVYGYPLDKRLLLDYEESLSSILGYTSAQDSIAKQAAAFEKLNYNLRKIEPQERIFIEYGNIERSSPAKYNASNPIPEMEIYKQGTVYRIRLGAFLQKQPVSLFKGVSPLCFEKNEEDRFVYYAGAFKEASEAESAYEQLKEMGFRKPEIVVWEDGAYRMIGVPNAESEDTSAEPAETLYRVEIAGQGENLSASIKELTDRSAPGKELTRTVTDDGTHLYSVGNFTSKEEADALCNAINEIVQGSATVLTIENN